MTQLKPQTFAFTEVKSEFQVVDVSLISGGHFVHDVFTAFVSPLLPEIIRTLGISLTQVGILSAMMQIPSLLNPLIGYIDDRRNLRFLMVLAPGITATLLSYIGLAPNYASLLILLFTAGTSIAVFHAIAPARLTHFSGQNVGRGMSFFMAGGELGRTVGPLLAVWAVSIWTLKGLIPLSLLGWLASLILWIRLRKSHHTDKIKIATRHKFPPGTLIFFTAASFFIFFRGLMISSLGMYLPTFMTGEGADLWKAGGALALYQLSGSLGALAGGTISDRFDRRKVLAVTMAGSSISLLLFLMLNNWLSFLLLMVVGFMNLTTQPIMLALTQDNFPENRSMANGMYMAISFIALSATTIIVGGLGDWIGLRPAFTWCGFFSLFALPCLLLIRPSGNGLQSQ
jgi:FSR family fosmidomycin resistance protein-like MFS transporter